MKKVYTAASRKKPSMKMEYTQKTAPSKSVSLTSPYPCKQNEARPVDQDTEERHACRPRGARNAGTRTTPKRKSQHGAEQKGEVAVRV